MVASFLALAKSIYYALSARANKIFQKPTVFVFTKSQSTNAKGLFKTQSYL